MRGGTPRKRARPRLDRPSTPKPFRGDTTRFGPRPGGYRFFPFLPPLGGADFAPRSFAAFLPVNPLVRNQDGVR